MKKNRIIIFIVMFIGLFPLFLQGEIQKPVAQFVFTKASYQLGEPIEVVENSYSPTGAKITKKEWKIIIEGKEKKSSNVKTLLRYLKKEGNYTIYLTVKDNNGTWSNAISRNIKITSSKSLEIKNFTTEKTTYAIGEKIQFVWEYDNPNNIDVKSQRWRYKNLTSNSSLVAGKPNYFRKSGKYEITLELQDEWGNWSNKKTCYVIIGQEEVTRNGEYLFNEGRQGDLLEGYIDKDYNTFDELQGVQVQDTPGKLIMSNSPESVPSSGILYRDTVSGNGIMTVHHSNASNAAKKLVILATSKEEHEITLTISNEAILGPNTNILKTGQNSVNKYFTGKASKNYILKPGETICIYDSQTKKSWRNGDIISGLFDFNSTGNVSFTVAALDENATLSSISTLQALPRSIHARGTFDVVARKYIVDVKGLVNPSKLVIGKEQEEWLVGVDALTGQQVRNQGNYGLPITIEVKNKEDIGVILNARGGSYQGAIKWNDSKVFDIPDEDILSSKKLAALVGKIPANKGASILYTLPNGSSAPVLFGFIPSSFWK